MRITAEEPSGGGIKPGKVLLYRKVSLERGQTQETLTRALYVGDLGHARLLGASNDEAGRLTSFGALALNTTAWSFPTRTSSWERSLTQYVGTAVDHTVRTSIRMPILWNAFGNSR